MFLENYIDELLWPRKSEPIFAQLDHGSETFPLIINAVSIETNVDEFSELEYGTLARLSNSMYSESLNIRSLQ